MLFLGCAPLVFLQVSDASLSREAAQAVTWDQHRAVVRKALNEDRYVELDRVYTALRAQRDNLERQSAHAMILARWAFFEKFTGHIEPRRLEPGRAEKLLRTLEAYEVKAKPYFALTAQFQLENVVLPTDWDDSNRFWTTVTINGKKVRQRAINLMNGTAGQRRRLKALSEAAYRKNPHDPVCIFNYAFRQSNNEARFNLLLKSYTLSQDKYWTPHALYEVVKAAQKVGNVPVETRFVGLLKQRITKGGNIVTAFLMMNPQFAPKPAKRS